MFLRHPYARRRGVAARLSARTLLSTAIAVALIPAVQAWAETVAVPDAAPTATAATTPGTANDDAPTQMSDIVVTGQRSALDRSVIAKKLDDHIVEVIATDNMGQMPNVSIAESLVRLPGVNGILDRGNISQASVRGLGPRMTMGTVNDREIASSEPTRSVRWEVFPTEVVSTVKVYKTQSADLIAGGIASTIDISTVNPLDYYGPAFVANAGGVYYDEGKDVSGFDPFGGRFGASWVHKLNDNLAVAIGGSYQKQKNANALMGSWGYTDDSSAMKFNPSDSHLTYSPWGAADELKLLDQTRSGAVAALQYRTDNFELKLDGLYSKVVFDENQSQEWFNGWAYSIWSGSNPYTTPGSSYTTIDNDVVAGTLANSYLEADHVIANYNETKTLAALGANAKWKFDDWTVATDLSHSQAARDNAWTAVRFGSNPATVSFDFRDGVTPYIRTSADAPAWGIAGEIEPQHLHDEITAFAANASRALSAGPFTSLDFGLRAADREKSNQHFILNQSGYDAPISAYSGLYSSYSMPSLDVPPLTKGDIDAIAKIGFGGFNPSLMSEQLLDHWDVKEDIREAFVKAPFASTLWSKDVTGNIGIRVVHVDTTSTGYDSIDGTPQPSRATNSYTDALPSATLNFALDDERVLRLAASRAASRPPLDELRTGRSLDNPATTVGQLTGSGGNPYLKPFLANQLDASYEWYFHKESLAAFAVYRKWVDSSIGYKQEHETIEGHDYLITGPFNAGGGYINGMELTFQTPLYFIPHLENFGIYSNYAYVQSNLKEFSPVDNPLPLSGLTRNTGTVDLWYSNGVFDARIGYKYHSPFTMIYGWNETHLTRLQSEGTVDMSLGWQINNLLGLKFQVGNLTNERMRVYTDNKVNRLANQDDGGYQVFGRRFELTATIKL